MYFESLQQKYKNRMCKLKVLFNDYVIYIHSVLAVNVKPEPSNSPNSMRYQKKKNVLKKIALK